MAGAPLNPALAPYFLASGRRWGIPPAILAGVADVETDGGRNTATSSTGARGPMQFEPATAARYGVDVTSAPSEIDGAAHYLHDLGFSSNPTRAIASYNAGPGNYTAGLGYARQVLSNASRLSAGLGGFTPSSSSSTGAGGAGGSYGGLSGFLLRAALTIGLVIAGLILAGVGARSALGKAPAPA